MHTNTHTHTHMRMHTRRAMASYVFEGSVVKVYVACCVHVYVATRLFSTLIISITTSLTASDALMDIAMATQF